MLRTILEDVKILPPSLAQAEWRHQLNKWNKEREEAQQHIDDQARFLYTLQGTSTASPLTSTLTHLQQQHHQLQQQQLQQQQLQQQVQQQHLPFLSPFNSHIPVSAPPLTSSVASSYDPSDTSMVSYIVVPTF